MAQGILTPLQLTAAAGMLDNTGLKPLPLALTTALDAFNSTTVMIPLNSALADAAYADWCSPTTLQSLQTMQGSSNGCPALGNSIPPGYNNLSPVPSAQFPEDSALTSSGFTGLIEATGNAYLGDGDLGKFAQGFMAVQGYISVTNSFINSVDNAQTYLGPTFSGMDALITNGISSVNSNLIDFSRDLANQGQLVDFNNLDFYGTPAGLLAQISNQGNMLNGTLPAITSALQDQGLTESDIANLVNLNVESLFNPNGLTSNQFDQLQKLAYPALAEITGLDLADVLSILEISTPNITTLADLLNVKVMFPNSYQTMLTPSPQGPRLIYGPDGSVNMDLQSVVGDFLPTVSGCDQLSKILPPDQAVSSKATQASLQQISGIADSSPPLLANAIAEFTRRPWTVDSPYLKNDLVAAAAIDPITGLAQLSPDTVYYRAQENVPMGIDITNSQFWQPTGLGSLCTMQELPLIEAQTTPLDPSVASYFDNNIATGSGPNGTITTCDIIGTAINYGNLNVYLDSATSSLQDIIDASGAVNLIDIYSRMSNVTDGTYGDPYTSITVPAGYGAGTYTSSFPYYAGDLALQALIPLANTEIDSIISSYPTETSALNSAFDSLADILNKEKSYQIEAGIDYFAIPAGQTTSVMALIQNLSQYGQQGEACGPFAFLDQISDKDTLTGQAIVGSLCEGENEQLLRNSRLGANLPQTKPSPNLAVTPSRVV